MNRQQLRYVVVQDPTRVAYINEHIHFAALLGKASAFQKSHYSPVYIGIIQTHPHPYSDLDTGIAADTIKVTASSLGFGSCILASFKDVDEVCKIKDQEVLRVLIAIGHPAHQSTIVPAQKSLAYYQDEQHHFYVPKKALSKIVTIL